MSVIFVIFRSTFLAGKDRNNEIFEGWLVLYMSQPELRYIVTAETLAPLNFRFRMCLNFSKTSGGGFSLPLLSAVLAVSLPQSKQIYAAWL